MHLVGAPWGSGPIRGRSWRHRSPRHLVLFSREFAAPAAGFINQDPIIGVPEIADRVGWNAHRTQKRTVTTSSVPAATKPPYRASRSHRITASTVLPPSRVVSAATAAVAHVRLAVRFQG